MRLRENQENMKEAIDRLDCGEFDNGIMAHIRAQQHKDWKDAADAISVLQAEVKQLREENLALIEYKKLWFEQQQTLKN